jgi:hypothetical protein
MDKLTVGIKKQGSALDLKKQHEASRGSPCYFDDIVSHAP